MINHNKEIIDLTERARSRRSEQEAALKMKLHREKLVIKEEQQEKLKQKRKANAEERLRIASSSMSVSSGILGQQLMEDSGVFTLKNSGTHGIAASRISEEVSKLRRAS